MDRLAEMVLSGELKIKNGEAEDADEFLLLESDLLRILTYEKITGKKSLFATHKLTLGEISVSAIGGALGTALFEIGKYWGSGYVETKTKETLQLCILENLLEMAGIDQSRTDQILIAIRHGFTLHSRFKIFNASQYRILPFYNLPEPIVTNEHRHNFLLFSEYCKNYPNFIDFKRQFTRIFHQSPVNAYVDGSEAANAAIERWAVYNFALSGLILRETA